MRIPKSIESRIIALQNKRYGTFYPYLASIELVKAGDYPPIGAEHDAEHIGEYRIIIGHWNGKAGTGGTVPNHIDYAQSESEASEAIDEYLKTFPGNPFEVVTFVNDYGNEV